MQTRSHRGGPLKLVKSLRGDGILMWGRRACRRVAYRIDVYRQGLLISGDGEVSGEFSELVGRSPANARLRLAGGQEVPVGFLDIGADAASIELVGPLPSIRE